MFRKLLCVLVLALLVVFAGAGCTGPADTGGATPSPGPSEGENTTDH